MTSTGYLPRTSVQPRELSSKVRRAWASLPFQRWSSSQSPIRPGSARGRVEYLDALRDSGRKVLASAQATVEGKGISCKTVLAVNVAGNVADIIVERARELQADVMVMGTHGRRGVRRLVLGGDVEAVVRTSPVPVLLVRSDTEPRTS